MCAFRISIVDKNEKKGQNFEEHIAELFPKERFDIVRWTTDICSKHDRFVESDMDPDFIFREKETKKEFAVECKYRSNFIFKGDMATIQWAKPEQLKRYKDFEKKNKMPVFIVIGVGGTPSEPEFLFCLPLKEIKYPQIFDTVFAPFERIPDKEFIYYNDTLL